MIQFSLHRSMNITIYATSNIKWKILIIIISKKTMQCSHMPSLTWLACKILVTSTFHPTPPLWWASSPSSIMIDFVSSFYRSMLQVLPLPWWILGPSLIVTRFKSSLRRGGFRVLPLSWRASSPPFTCGGLWILFSLWQALSRGASINNFINSECGRDLVRFQGSIDDASGQAFFRMETPLSCFSALRH